MCTFSGKRRGRWNGGDTVERKAGGRPVLPGLSPHHGPGAGRSGGGPQREDVLRQLARLAFGRVDDAVRLALCRGEVEISGLELSAISELRVAEKGVEVKLVDRVRALETLWKLLDAGEPQGSDPLYQALTELGRGPEEPHGE